MNTPDSSGWSSRTQAGIDASVSAGFETRNDTQRGSIASPSPNASRSGVAPGARRSARISVAELALDDQLAEVLVGQALAGAAAGVLRGGEGREHPVVEEVGERPVADVVEEARDPQRLDDEPLGRAAARRARASAARPAARAAAPAPTGPPRASPRGRA